ncbi:MAG: SurA N-terminal domain-containing protein, partial [Bacteroidales bacterium]
MINHVHLSLTGARRFVLLTLALAGLTSACQAKPAAPPVSANAWAVVNGQEITRDDVDKAYRRSDQSAQPAAEDEAFAAKLAVLDDLVIQDLLLARARELKIDVPQAELDKAYAEASKNMPEEAFKQELARRSLTAADMREGLRREMVVQKLLEREVTSKVTVTDQEIAAFFEANKPQFNRTEDSYRVAQIVITPVKDAQITNRTGSDATTPQEAAAKLQMVMERLKAGTQFSEVAADFSEEPQSAPRGGDMGFLPLSAIQKYPPQLRDAVLTAKPGSAKVLGANGGYVILVVLGKDPAGQKDLATPGVKDAIRDSLKGRREQLLRAAYLSTLRNGAVIDNLIAKRIVEAQGKVPTLAPAAPGA